MAEKKNVDWTMAMMLLMDIKQRNDVRFSLGKHQWRKFNDKNVFVQKSTSKHCNASDLLQID